MNTLASTLVLISWAAFLVVWFVFAFNVKRTIKRDYSWAKWFAMRIAIVVVFLIVIRYLVPHSVWTSGQFLKGYRPLFPALPWLAPVGGIIAMVGVAFAIWARIHLGRNWSGVPSIKEGHELITTGPYRFVRHPIYTGVIAALLGTALVEGIVWAVVCVAGIAVFLARIPVEERIMMQLFPDQYPEYRKRSKALIPFVW